MKKVDKISDFMKVHYTCEFHLKKNKALFLICFILLPEKLIKIGAKNLLKQSRANSYIISNQIRCVTVKDSNNINSRTKQISICSRSWEDIPEK